MYETYYGLSQRPFSLLPNPHLLYPASGHKAAIEVLQAAFAQDARVCLITGEVGAGKTTLKLRLIEVLNDKYHIGHIANASDSFSERPSWILQAFNIKCGDQPAEGLYQVLIEQLSKFQDEEQRPVLIIDESQILTVDACLSLDHLVNAARENNLPLQVVLFGQHQVRDTLAEPALQDFRENIEFDYHLAGLNETETRNYITYRIRASNGDPALFTDAAMKAVHQQSGGIPRIINVICDTALVYGYMEASPVINSAIITIVGSDRQHAGLTEGMWQAPEPVLMQTDQLSLAEAAEQRVDFQLAELAPVPLAETGSLPTLDDVARSTDTGSKDQTRRRGRILDTISIVMVLVLALLVWLGRDALFPTVEAPVAATGQVAPAGEKSDFATLDAGGK